MRTIGLATIVALLVLAGCGGDDEGDSQPSASPTTAATESATTEKLPWPPPTAESIVGEWRRQGQTEHARFKPDGTFAIGDDLRNPFTEGTYELDGSTVAFASELAGGCRGATWLWEVGLDREGSDDVLHVIFAKGGCAVPTGTRWSLARID
jgi:hypothetical protein